MALSRVLGNGRASAIEVRAAAPAKYRSLAGERSEHNRTVVAGAGEKVSGKIPFVADTFGTIMSSGAKT